MPKVEIDLSGKTLASLERVAEEFNAQTGQTLTVNELIILSLKQKAIEKDILSESERIRRELDAEFPLRIAARRRGLLDALG